MNQMKWVILLLLAFIHQGALAAPKNESKIVVSNEKSEASADFPDAQFCKGEIPNTPETEKRLKAIGITTEVLKNGVGCIASDFDKNGSLDFILYGVRVEKEKRRYSAAFYFDGPKLIRTQYIVPAMALLKPNDPERSRFPKKKGVAGLVRHTEPGFQNGIIYFFDKKTGLFQGELYIYENGSTGE